jgi:hypothetical protein
MSASVRGVIIWQIVSAALLTWPAFARDAKGAYHTFGVSPVSCAEYVGARGTEIAERNRQRGTVNQLFTRPYMEFFHFTEGWLTAVNGQLPDTFNVLPSGLEPAMLWLENYCRQNPLAAYNDGLFYLLQALYPKRQQYRPSAGGQQ